MLSNKSYMEIFLWGYIFMDDNMKWHNDAIGKKVATALVKNRFDAVYVATKSEAVQKALSMIPAKATIGCGGSMSRTEVGLMDILKEESRGHIFFDWHKHDMPLEEKTEARRKATFADVFLASSNAVTMDGQLLNIDGTGNRVASMAFGPQKVILIIGVNKIVKDVAAGLERMKMIARPVNNKRLNLPNPCVQTGFCVECELPSRICNVTTIMHKKPMLTDISIIVVGEDLGY